MKITKLVNNTHYLQVSCLIAILCCFFSCKTYKNQSYYEYSSKPQPSLKRKDTTNVILHIDFYKGCTQSEFAFIGTRPFNNDLTEVNCKYLEIEGGNSFIISNDSFFNALNLLEKACSEHNGCGGYGGGTGVSIEKHYKGMMTYFNYCQEYGLDEGWNGLEYFFGLMGKKLVDYPFK